MGKIFKLHPIEGSATFHKITTGRQWVGRVTQHADGQWLGIIGKLMVKRPTRALAFDDVVAQYLGLTSGAELRAKNARVRRGKRLVNQVADRVYQEVLGGNFAPLDVVHKGRPIGMELALRGATRDLRRVRNK
jgi:hypothetical protein